LGPRCVRRASSALEFEGWEVDSFRADQATVALRDAAARRQKPDLWSPTLPFGRHFTDHQLEVRWDCEDGWSNPEIRPQRDIPTHPASLALNHGVSCFEGMKAFAGEDGQVRLFRPELNMARLVRSAVRLALPEFEPEELLLLIKQLVALDRDWTPRAPGSSLYIRPVVSATNGTIGFKVEQAMVTVVLAPGGPFFPTGLQPINMLVDKANLRAAPGGVGSYKAAGNYAPTLTPLQCALADHDCQQVLFTADGQVGECAAMNVMFLVESTDGAPPTLITPSLDDGTILPGVTRQSVLELARSREWRLGGSGSEPSALAVEERAMSVDELEEIARSGRLLEVRLFAYTRNAITLSLFVYHFICSKPAACLQRQAKGCRGLTKANCICVDRCSGRAQRWFASRWRRLPFLGHLASGIAWVEVRWRGSRCGMRTMGARWRSRCWRRSKGSSTGASRRMIGQCLYALWHRKALCPALEGGAPERNAEVGGLAGAWTHGGAKARKARRGSVSSEGSRQHLWAAQLAFHPGYHPRVISAG
jgi:branched-subunit amino acid aminotransferase/4-amino-4-deoxychorismate lyase